MGDLHGCLDELRELVKLVEYRPGKDRLVLIGDLVDRGPYPVETVRWAMRHGVSSVKGNHEANLVDFRRREAIALAGGPPNGKRRPYPKRMDEWMAFTADELSWMDKLPLWVDLGGDWLAVHAGFEPKPLAEQKEDRVLRIRWVDEKTGEYVGMKKVPVPESAETVVAHGNSDPARAQTPEAIAKRERRQRERIAKGLPAVVEQKRRPKKYNTTYEQPGHSKAWQEVWPGPQKVIYGHAANKGMPRVDGLPPGTIGVDTGCVYGYKLTAAILVDGEFREFAQVQAREEYYPWPTDGE